MIIHDPGGLGFVIQRVWGDRPMIRFRRRSRRPNVFTYAAWWLDGGENFYTRALKRAKTWAHMSAYTEWHG